MRIRFQSSVVMVLAAATFAAAQEQPGDRSQARPSATRPLPVWDGPPAPILPNVINRDEKRRATIRAVRINQPPVFDGRLDDEVYGTVTGASGFIQAMPKEGAPALEPTAVWVFFDDKNLYLSARCHDSHPDKEIVNELRRDNGSGINGNEGLSLGLETPAQSVTLEVKPYGILYRDNRPNGRGAAQQRPHRGRGARRQVWADARPDRRHHRQHRLRAG